MSEIVRFESAEGQLLVEVDDARRMGLERVSGGKAGEKIVDAAESFEEAVDSVLKHAQKVLESLEKLKPDGAEIEFGIKLTAQAGALLAKAGGEANFNVKLSWESSAPK